MDRRIAGTDKGLSGELRVPGDKSISHRAVMLGSISKGLTHVKGFLNGADCLSTIRCFREMGVDIRLSEDEEELWIKGRGLRGLRAPEADLDCGNSGTSIRLISGILAAQSFGSRITGDESIQRRPMKRIMTPLMEMGASIRSERENGCAPLIIEGRELRGISYDSPVASAQVKSSILLAGLYARGKTTVIEPGLSRDHTERMLKALGAEVITEELSDGRARISMLPPHELYAPEQTLEIPGDISSAAYPITAALMVPGSDILIRNVGVNGTRDGILRVYRSMGADISLENPRLFGAEEVADIRVRYSRLRGCVISGSIIPSLIDELPVIAIAAAGAEGRTVIRDARELKVKESNRIEAMCAGLRSLGIEAVETDDGMEILGQGKELDIREGTIESFRDHRIAMSFAVLGLRLGAGRSITIRDAECIQISFPGFFELMDRLRQG